MQIQSLSLDSFSEAEVETRVQHEKGRSALNMIESISSRGRSPGQSVSHAHLHQHTGARKAGVHARRVRPAPSPPTPAALRRPQSQSPAAAGSRTSRFLVAGLRRSRRSPSGAGQNRRRDTGQITALQETRARGRVTLRKCALGQVGRSGGNSGDTGSGKALLLRTARKRRMRLLNRCILPFHRLSLCSFHSV